MDWLQTNFFSPQQRPRQLTQLVHPAGKRMAPFLPEMVAGSLLKSQISIRTWADWDEAAPGFVQIDLVGHEGGDTRGLRP
jgi:hypothetical protein